jgi:putative colanic acid biosynthesis UDP-glucose lipid carrier transferase
MGKRFHKNSLYIFLLRVFILLFDLIGLNSIILLLTYVLNEPFELNIVSDIHLKYLIISHNITWIVLSYFFKTYEKNFQIIYNLKSSFKLFFFHLLILLSFSLLFLNSIHINSFFIYLYFFCSFIYLPISRYLTSYYLNKLDNIIHLRKRVAILGDGEIYPKLFEYLKSEDSGYKLIPVLPKVNSKNITLAIFEEAILTAKRNNISEIFSIAMPLDDAMHLKIVNMAEKEFIRFKFTPEFDMVLTNQFKIIVKSETLVVDYTKEPLEELDNRIRKRIFDLIISSIVIVFVLSWLYPIIALLIKLDSKGPVLFKQLRSGRKNVSFTCLKFRTMIPNDIQDTKQAEKHDYRFTRIGKFLRKSNLDELPQFFNVFFGQMSVIGPRPHMLNHTKQYGDIVEFYMQRHFIKPGISGWAQINGLRGNLDHKMMEIRVKYDLQYIKNWSIWHDIDIMFKTFMLTLVGDDNAY